MANIVFFSGVLWARAKAESTTPPQADGVRTLRNESKKLPPEEIRAGENAEIPEAVVSKKSGRILAGSEQGLFGFEQGKGRPLWTGAAVRKILKAGDTWFLLSGEGIQASADLENWEGRNQGLPVKTIKLYRNGVKSFLPAVQEIKDLEADPEHPEILVCATKDRVFLTRDGGRNWKSLGMPPYRTNGIKAVAVLHPAAEGRARGGGTDTDEGTELTVFVSHSTYGIHYIEAAVPGARWTELNTGLETLETTENPDETADIAAVLEDEGSQIYASQTFRRRIYRLDWEAKSFRLLWSDASVFGTVDSLNPAGKTLRFVSEGAVAELDLSPGGGMIPEKRDDVPVLLRKLSGTEDSKFNCLYLEDEKVNLSELWLLGEAGKAGLKNSGGNEAKIHTALAEGRNGLYLPVNHAMDSADLKPYLDLMADRGLNMAVIDMKDDYGRLRFSPLDKEIEAKGRVFRPLDIDKLLKTMKERGIYTAARIVVFKDPVLAARGGGKYAVWDGKTNKAWAGYRDTRRKKGEESGREDLIEILGDDPLDREYELVRSFYDERWVDPYSEEVWDYTARIAEELQNRGFDEIQFDYIRFPTDGVNLADIRYRWQDSGMDMESAILSFLRHIRGRVKVPISIDIYGANGWYRTGARTGQELELLAPWVDVICPMYYPSHFEQDFLAQSPEEERPYRIYYFGTLRSSRIGRGQIVVRPYVQAFYLNVSYDRRHYNADYVRREAEGVQDAGNGGLTYWNNSGRYEDIPKIR
ncbi:MAG: putative glycoside hydrolase [Treponema sp.]|nr:putative glycoside hydrolase [Treponema sp.]